MTNNVKAVLDDILEKFPTGDKPDAVALASFPGLEVPSSQCRTLMQHNFVKMGRYRYLRIAFVSPHPVGIRISIAAPVTVFVEDRAGNHVNFALGLFSIF